MAQVHPAGTPSVDSCPKISKVYALLEAVFETQTSSMHNRESGPSRPCMKLARYRNRNGKERDPLCYTAIEANRPLKVCFHA